MCANHLLFMSAVILLTIMSRFLGENKSLLLPNCCGMFAMFTTVSTKITKLALSNGRNCE